MTGKKPDPRARRVGLCESPRKAASPPKPSGRDALVQPSIGSGVPIRNFPLSPEIISYDDPTRPYEPDRWWFAPLLYAGTAVLIAALVLA